MLDKIVVGVGALIMVALLGYLIFIIGPSVSSRDERRAEAARIQAETRFRIWPDTAISVAYPAAWIEKTEDFVVFVDLRSGNRTEMPLCSVRSIEEMSR